MNNCPVFDPAESTVCPGSKVVTGREARFFLNAARSGMNDINISPWSSMALTAIEHPYFRLSGGPKLFCADATGSNNPPMQLTHGRSSILRLQVRQVLFPKLLWPPRLAGTSCMFRRPQLHPADLP